VSTGKDSLEAVLHTPRGVTGATHQGLNTNTCLVAVPVREEPAPRRSAVSRLVALGGASSVIWRRDVAATQASASALRIETRARLETERRVQGAGRARTGVPGFNAWNALTSTATVLRRRPPRLRGMSSATSSTPAMEGGAVGGQYGTRRGRH
jgi:hypothetical protein